MEVSGALLDLVLYCRMFDTLQCESDDLSNSFLQWYGIF